MFGGDLSLKFCLQWMGFHLMGRRMLWETDYLNDWSRSDGVTLSRALTEADVSPRWLWDRMLAFGGLGPSRGDFGSWLVAQSQLLPRKISQVQEAASAFAGCSCEHRPT
jgi:hypothetical protein